MENPASQAHPTLCPEVLALLADHPQGFRPSRARQAALMEEALVELERFAPLLELRLGQVLAPMLRGGHKHLGYVTPAMFCREELGISATAAWDSVRLAEGLLRRSILRQAFLEGALPRTHALELLRLDPTSDAEWAARAASLPVQELRRALRPLRSSMAGEEKETARVRTYDLEAEPYATWLAAVELARRREGRDLDLAHVLEQILAEFAAARPLQAAAEGTLTADPSLQAYSRQPGIPKAHLLQSVEGEGGPSLPASLLLKQEAGPEVAEDSGTPTPPPFQRDPRWPATAPPSTPDSRGGKAGPSGAASDLGSARTGSDGAEAGAGQAMPDSAQAPPELPCLLRQDLPRSPRKLTRLARRLLASRERLELQRGRILRRVQEGRLYREAGFRSFRGWLNDQKIAPSTAFQATARDQRLERHEALRQALCEGHLSPTKVDLLLRLPRRADPENWAAYAEEHTCRRLEEAVEAALVLATRFPAAWNLRLGTAPGEEETLEEFRQQAGLQGFEATCEDLARAFEQVESSRTAPEGVQTSAAPPPASTSDPSSGANAPTEGFAGGSRSLAAASQGRDALQTKANLPGTQSEPAGPSGPEAPETAEPPPTLRLRLVLPESLDRLLLAAEATLRRDAGEALSGEECLYVLCLVFLRQAGQEDSGQSRVRRQALERAGYRCEVPGCACRTNLHVHHIQRRSQGGSDELENLAVACASHHLRHLHGGTMRVEGQHPSTRIWEIGLEEGEPWRVWCDERLVDGEALNWEGDDAESPDAESPQAAETPAAESPAAETPDAETPNAETPDAETPDAESPDAETPDAETPAAETPAADRVCEATPESRAA